MKTGLLDAPTAAAPIVALSDAEGGSEAQAFEDSKLLRARAFAEPLLMGQVLDSGEEALGHCEGTCAILEAIGASPALLAAVYLVYASNYLQKPAEVVAKAFGESYASMVGLTHKLVQVQRQARSAQHDEAAQAEQTERVRKMLLAFSKDLRVVLLRLASRLQTLRHFAATKQPCPEHIAHEALQVFAPLANRLGIWQIKWELEDLSFRFLMPDTYRSIAKSLDEKRLERERHIERVTQGDGKNDEDGDQRIKRRLKEGFGDRASSLGDDHRRTAGVGSHLLHSFSELRHHKTVVVVALRRNF